MTDATPAADARPAPAQAPDQAPGQAPAQVPAPGSAAPASAPAIKPASPVEGLHPAALAVARITTDELGAEYDRLLGFIQISVELLKPATLFESLEAIRHARHHHAIFHYEAIANALQKINRRPALRQFVKPDWRPKAQPTGESAALQYEKDNQVETEFGSASMDMSWDNDADLEEIAQGLAKAHGMGALAVDATAFRLGLLDHSRIMDLIRHEARERDEIEESFLERRKAAAKARSA